MNPHITRLITKQGAEVARLQTRREKADEPIAEYVLYLNKLYRAEAHGILDENNTVISTYREVSQRVVVYS
jgi:hypothetical protein